MTLVLNEIHVAKGLPDSVVVAAADRRITLGGKYNSTRRKLFDIPYLNASISYYGLAELPCKGEYLSSWLPNFITRHSDAQSMVDLAGSLRQELHEVLPTGALAHSVSGFHICGFNSNGLPDFYHLTNVEVKDGQYKEKTDRYKPPTSDFLGRDAKEELGWDGHDPMAIKPGVWVYRNGDFVAHALASEAVDIMLDRFFKLPNFPPPKTPQDYLKFVEFKFKVIAYTYKQWAKQKLIGGDIDVIVRTKERAWATPKIRLYPRARTRRH
jgi:hypothetical protein